MTGWHRQGHHSVETAAAGDSPVHRLDPRAKIVGLVGLAIVSATTTPGLWGAFAAYGVILGALAAVAGLRPRYVLRRMVIEVPFLLAAAALAVTRGLELGATVAAKASVGVLAMVVLSSTTPFPQLLRGFEGLRAPRMIVMIVAFMWRYLHVLGEELRRMRIARAARAYRPRWFWEMGALAAGAAALFVRALERGERVHVAMLSRGHTGSLPLALEAPAVLRGADAVFLVTLAVVLAAARVAS